MEKRYDYIICGAGCAGLSLAYYLSKKNLDGKRILLLDKDAKDHNDHTWCFWQKGDGPFDTILKKSYSRIDFYTNEVQREINIAPYAYKRIDGIDFYNYIKPIIEMHQFIDFKQDQILSIEELENEVIVNTKESVYKSQLIFKSFLDSNFSFEKDHHVLQHFKGWEIETEEPQFDEGKATFMDFRIDQKGEIRFLYVLPTSTNTALVEVAIFSNNILTHSEYDTILKNYIDRYLRFSKYSILESEFGVIPMTTYPFETLNSDRIKHIGTAGGWVKASSGYAFDRIQRRSKSLANAIANQSDLNGILSAKNRFRFYDRIFLNVLLSNKAGGDEVFGKLFENLDSELIFKFLDEETNLAEDIKLFTGPPTMPFIKAFFEEL